MDFASKRPKCVDQRAWEGFLKHLQVRGCGKIFNFSDDFWSEHCNVVSDGLRQQRIRMILWLLPHCLKLSPHAFYLEEKVEVFAAEALRNPEVNPLQFGSPLQ